MAGPTSEHPGEGKTLTPLSDICLLQDVLRSGSGTTAQWLSLQNFETPHPAFTPLGGALLVSCWVQEEWQIQ